MRMTSAHRGLFITLAALLAGLGQGACGFRSIDVDNGPADASSGDTETETETDDGYTAEPPQLTPRTLSAGSGHTCALSADGEVLCWGHNRGGAAGGGEWLRYPAGVVEGFGAGNTAVSAGGHTCALTGAGGVLCMGMNWAGQLGTSEACPDDDDGNCIFESPVAPVGLESGVAAIRAGGVHTCAILEGGDVVCFGDGCQGQTGQPYGQDEPCATTVPAPVVGLDAPAVDLALGINHTCALLENGEVMCWGWQIDALLGNPDVPDGVVSTPVEVPGLEPGALALAVSYEHSCAVRADGAVLCWGRCDYGGNCGTTVDGWLAESPVVVDGLPDAAIDVAAGQGFTCILSAGREVYCFGSQGASATAESIATDDYSQIVPPHRIEGLPDDIEDISAGYGHACAQAADGTAYCWGDLSNGQLGVMPLGRAFAIPGLGEGVTKIAATADAVCGILADGTVRCFSFPEQAAASATDYDLGATAIAMGDAHTCALDGAGALHCWGDSAWSQLGAYEGDSSAEPVAIDDLPAGLSAIGARENATAVLADDGRVFLVGDYEREVNNPECPTVVRDPAPPMEIDALEGSTALVDGTCAIDASGSLSCISRVDSDAAALSLPSDVPDDAVALGRGADHSCWISADGAVSCEGNDDWGQIGDGEASTDSGSSSEDEGPSDVAGLDAPTMRLAAGDYHTCALSETGAVLCWGWNVFGQLGDGTMTPRATPVAPVGIAGAAVDVAASRYVGCALTEGGAVYCWGQRVFPTYDHVVGDYLTEAMPVLAEE